MKRKIGVLCKCGWGGKSFYSHSSRIPKFCSKKCYANSQPKRISTWKKKEKVEKVCSVCGSVFHSAYPRRRFCCPACARVSQCRMSRDRQREMRENAPRRNRKSTCYNTPSIYERVKSVMEIDECKRYRFSMDWGEHERQIAMRMSGYDRRNRRRD